MTALLVSTCIAAAPLLVMHVSTLEVPEVGRQVSVGEVVDEGGNDGDPAISMPSLPGRSDGAARMCQQIVWIPVTDDEPVASRTVHPTDKPGVDRLISEPVSDDDDAVRLMEIVAKTEV